MNEADSTAVLRDAIWAALPARHDDVVAFCRRLVQTPSVNGEHPEASVTRVIVDELRRLDVEPTVVAYAEERPCVVASAGRGAAGMLFVGHTDTVAVGDEDAWSVAPFGGEVRDGRLYGRGACDNKAGIAVVVHLLGVLRTFEDRLGGRVLLACVPDEESGATGRLGIIPLLCDGYLDADAAIYTYPNLDVISIGHRGLLRVRLVAHGEAAHTGGDEWERGERGVNAVTGMAALLLHLEAWQPAFEPNPAFPGRRPAVTPGTIVRGGHMASMVPARCEALVDLRLLPGQDTASLLQEMRAMADQTCAQRPGLTIDLTPDVDLPAVAISPETPLVRSLARWTERLAGIQPTIAGAGPANEGYLLIRAGIPTVCGFGPPGGNAHAADEYVEVDGLLTAAKIYAAAVLDMVHD